ncbi:MAG: PAS domain S-box protein [Pirellulales bacterium]
MPSADEFSLQRELAQALRSSTGAPLLLLNRAGQITFASPAAEELLGRKWPQLAGQAVASLLSAEARPAFERALADGGLLGDVRSVLERLDGRRIPVAFAMSPLEQDGGRMGAVLALRDLSAQHQAEQALEASERMFRELADALPQIVWITRPDGYHEYYNQHWWTYTGLSYEEAKGEGWNRLLHPEDRPRAIARWRQALDTGEPYEIEYRFRRASDGEYRWFLGRALPLCGDDGQIVRWFGTCTDIHDQKQAAQDLQQAKELAEGANRAKDQFLATVSHELRTPLSSILGYSQLLKLGLLAEQEVNEAVEAIERGAKALAQLVEDILDTSRIMNGKLRMEMKPVDMRTVVRNAIEAVRPLASEKGIDVVEQADEGPYVVQGDAQRLQQVVLNLLTNAVKFSAEGQTVRVLLDRTPLDEDQSRVQVSVVDEGVGIKPDFLPQVFERFQQADSSNVRQHGGLGLGLSIVKHLIEQHGGLAEAESAGEGQGATFSVSLPALPVESKHLQVLTLATAEAPVAVGALAGVKVLVVDDAPLARAIVESTLRKYGAQIVAANSVSQALAVLQDFTPDLVLSDIAMPGQDGYSLIEQLRSSDGPLARVPAIALTAFASVDDRSRASAAGFSAHLAKPVEPRELVAAVQRLVGEPVVIPH